MNTKSVALRIYFVFLEYKNLPNFLDVLPPGFVRKVIDNETWSTSMHFGCQYQDLCQSIKGKTENKLII